MSFCSASSVAVFYFLFFDASLQHHMANTLLVWNKSRRWPLCFSFFFVQRVSQMIFGVRIWLADNVECEDSGSHESKHNKQINCLMCTFEGFEGYAKWARNSHEHQRIIDNIGMATEIVRVRNVRAWICCGSTSVYYHFIFLPVLKMKQRRKKKISRFWMMSCKHIILW